jgi:3-hydroxybutyryl-CoA dehydrogenase
VTEERILVVGTGQVGPGIALSFALGGFEVVLSGRSDEKLAQGLAGVEQAGAAMVEHKLLREDAWHIARRRIKGEVDLGPAVRECTYVVEAIAENLEAKTDLLHRLEGLLGPEALLASTTSALSPSELQLTAELRDEHRVGLPKAFARLGRAVSS